MIRAAFHRAGLTFSVANSFEGADFIFQHGLCGDAGQPADVFPAGIGWRCTTLECRGHGQSEPGSPEDFSIATFADDLAAYIEAACTAPVVIGGISMGAAIALRLAVKRPDLVRALVIARPAWRVDAAPQNMQPNALVGALMRKYTAPEARQNFDASATAAMLTAQAPDNLASLHGFFTREPLEITRELLCRISADGPGVIESEVRALKIPALVIGHERDYVHPLQLARDVADMIPAARLAIITPKATNPAKYKAEFAAALTQFLKELT